MATKAKKTAAPKDAPKKTTAAKPATKAAPTAPVEAKEPKQDAMAVAVKANKTANEAAAEVRKLRTQMEDEGVITNAHANMRGGDLFRAKKAAMAVFVACLIGTMSFADETIAVRYMASKSCDNIIELNADNADDTDDQLQFGINTDNDFTVTIGGDEVLNITKDGALYVDSAGLDTAGATAMYIAQTTATSLNLSKTAIMTTVMGTLNVDEAVTLDSTLQMAGYANTLTAGTSLTLTSAHYGQYMTFTNQAAITVQLPANGAPAGTWIDVAQGTVQNNTTAITVEAATTDTLIGPNDIDLKSVTWGAGHRIGCYARFISDGGFWHVLNLGGTTMTYTD